MTDYKLSDKCAIFEPVCATAKKAKKNNQRKLPEKNRG
jgi:hypothetical protein